MRETRVAERLRGPAAGSLRLRGQQAVVPLTATARPARLAAWLPAQAAEHDATNAVLPDSARRFARRLDLSRATRRIRRRRAANEFRRLDAVLLEQVIERRAGDTEQLGGP